MKKFVSSILIVSLIVSIFAGCGTVQDDVYSKQVVSMLLPAGTPALSMIKLIEEEPKINGTKRVMYQVTTSTDVLAAKLINEEYDMAVIPSNLAANVYNKAGAYEILGSSIWGVFYIVSSDATVTSLEDIKGKTITTFGRGLTPDAVLNYVLSENGISADSDITLEYVGDSSEVAAHLVTGEAEIALVPQPLLANVLSKNEKLNVIVDLQEEWGKITGTDGYPQAVLVAKKSLVEENGIFVKNFIKEYEAAIDWVNMKDVEAGTYYEKKSYGLPAAMVTKAIPECNFEWKSAQDAKVNLEAYYKILLDFNGKLIGDKMPDDEMYYKE